MPLHRLRTLILGYIPKGSRRRRWIGKCCELNDGNPRPVRANRELAAMCVDDQTAERRPPEVFVAKNGVKARSALLGREARPRIPHAHEHNRRRAPC